MLYSHNILNLEYKKGWLSLIKIAVRQQNRARYLLLVSAYSKQQKLGAESPLWRRIAIIINPESCINIIILYPFQYDFRYLHQLFEGFQLAKMIYRPCIFYTPIEMVLGVWSNYFSHVLHFLTELGCTFYTKMKLIVTDSKKPLLLI